MKKKIIWVVVSCLMVLSLVIASCGPAEEEGEEEEEAVTGEKEMVSVTLTKLDGTTMTVSKEKPQYGGSLTMIANLAYMAMDPHEALLIRVGYAQASGNEMIQGKWTVGPTGTEEVAWMCDWMARVELMKGELAESWELPDDETIIYKLRKGVKYWNKPPVNGREVEAEDVVWWLYEAYNTPAMWQYMGYPPESGMAPTSFKALDKYTVEVKIAAEFQAIGLFEMGSNAYVYPREIWTEHGGIGGDWTKVVASGPFMLTDYVENSVATYSRNPDYFEYDPYFPENQLPYVDTYKELIIDDASTQLAAFRTAKIDYIKNLTSEDARQLIEQYPDVEYAKKIFGCSDIVAGRMDAPPFDDLRVRQALNLAVNQQEILDEYYDGDGELISWPFSPMKIFDVYYTPPEELPEEVTMLFTFDPERARELLTEAGYPDGFKTKCIVRNQPSSVDYVSLIKEYLADVNIDIDIEPVESSAFFGMLSNKAQKAGEMMNSGGIWVPNQPLSTKPRQFENHAWVDDPYYDEMLLSVGRDMVNHPKKFQQTVKDAAVHLLASAFGIWKPGPYTYNLWWPWLREYNGIDSTGWHDVVDINKYLWIDQDLKESMGY